MNAPCALAACERHQRVRHAPACRPLTSRPTLVSQKRKRNLVEFWCVVVVVVVVCGGVWCCVVLCGAVWCCVMLCVVVCCGSDTVLMTYLCRRRTTSMHQIMGIHVPVDMTPPGRVPVHTAPKTLPHQLITPNDELQLRELRSCVPTNRGSCTPAGVVVVVDVMVVVVVLTKCSARMFVHTHTRMQLIKMDQCQCTGPFGWTDQPKKTPRLFAPKAGSRRPQCKIQPTPSRGKRLPGTPASLPTPSEKGRRHLFHLLGVGCPGSGILCKETSGRVFLVSRTLCVFLVSRTLLTILPPVSAGRSGVMNCLFPPPSPALGKDQGGKRMVKILVQCRSFNVPSRSSKAEPVGYTKTPHIQP